MGKVSSEIRCHIQAAPELMLTILDASPENARPFKLSAIIQRCWCQEAALLASELSNS